MSFSDSGPWAFLQLWISEVGWVLLLSLPAGSPRFLTDLSLRAVPLPGKLHECFCLLLPHEFQASSSLADWPLSLCVTRPNRVHLRYGSQVHLTRLRQKSHPFLRSLGSLLNRQFTR